MKTYCISPPEIPWRRPLAEERFRKAGLEVEFFAGLHGPSLGLMPRLPAFDSPNYFISSGYVGLFLSNLLLWHLCLERGDDEVLVFEDDCEPCEGFAEKFPASMAALPDDWQIVSVGSCCCSDKPADYLNGLVARIRWPLCTHAMLYRRSALSEIIRRMRKVCNSHFDIQLAQLVFPHVRHYTFVPPLAFQAPPGDEGLHTMRGVFWQDIPGWFDFARIYDERLDHVRQPATFVEVGSWLGKSTAYMAEQIKRRYKPVAFYAVDTWLGSPSEPELMAAVRELGGDLFQHWQRNMSRAGVLDYVIPIRAPSVLAAERFSDRSIDFLMLDADHAYESVRDDLAAWRRKCRGVMAGHDIDREGVRQAVAEVFGDRFRIWERCWIVDTVATGCDPPAAAPR